jgi:hypothetical protein
VVEQGAQLARRGAVEGQQRRPRRPGRIADETAGGLDGGRVALALEELPQRREAGPQLARGRQVDVNGGGRVAEEIRDALGIG